MVIFTHISTLFYVIPDSRLGETETCPALAKDKVMHTPWMHKGKKRYSHTHTLLTVTLHEGVWSALPPTHFTPCTHWVWGWERNFFFRTEVLLVHVGNLWYEYGFLKIIVAGSPCIQSCHIPGTNILTWRKFNYWNGIGLLFKISIWTVWQQLWIRSVDDWINTINLINYSRFKPLLVSSLKEFIVRSNTPTSKQTIMERKEKKKKCNLKKEHKN
jgi:hypothetical protein